MQSVTWRALPRSTVVCNICCQLECQGVSMQGLETNAENVKVGKQAAESEILGTIIHNATLMVHCARDCSNTVHTPCTPMH